MAVRQSGLHQLMCGYGLECPIEEFTLCPCCCTQFGYSDANRPHAELRRLWIAHGSAAMNLRHRVGTLYLQLAIAGYQLPNYKIAIGSPFGGDIWCRFHQP